MGSPVISISEISETEQEVQIEMNPKTQPLEIVIEAEDGEIHADERDIFLKVPSQKKQIKLRGESGNAKLYASDINLPAGVYPYTICMDEKAIMSGYLLWSDNDK